MKSQFFLLMITLLPWAANAQTRIWQVPVAANHVQLRYPIVTVLDSIVMEAPVPGKVFVRFDGNTVSTPGDRIVLAASEYRFWNSNDGNTNVMVFDTLHSNSCFDHTRAYTVEAGSHTYYAVAQNYVDLSGDGFASINGHLTVEFIPDSQSEEAFTATGIVDGPWDWTDSVYLLKQISITAPVKGQILVNLEGGVDNDFPDDIAFTSNLSPAWPAHPEITEIPFSSDPLIDKLAHRKIYAVDAGDYTCYALARKTSGSLDNPRQYAYATLAARFIPDDRADIHLAYERLQDVAIVGHTPKVLGQLTFDAPKDGVILLQGSGQVESSINDSLWLTLVETSQPDIVLSQLLVEPLSEENTHTSVSLSGLTPVTEGNHSYQIIADFAQGSFGSGEASMEGLFTLQYVSNESGTGVEPVQSELPMALYPNPTHGIVFGQCTDPAFTGPLTLSLWNSSGTLLNKTQYASPDKVEENMERLPDGIYWIKIQAGEHHTIYPVVKNSGTH